jgi:phage-related protein
MVSIALSISRRITFEYNIFSGRGKYQMHEIIIYETERGEAPISDYIKSLADRQAKSKDSRVKYDKIMDYLDYLAQEGKQAGEPYIKHLDGEIWELRPLADRILFAAWIGESFILLHQFIKKTQKTPKREIEQAKRNLADYRRRHGNE